MILNGTAICAERSHKGENDADCSDTEIAFKKPVSIHIAANLLHLGANTLEFRVEQRKGVGFGLDYTGTVIFMTTPPYQGYILPYATSTKSPVTVPEPSSLAVAHRRDRSASGFGITKHEKNRRLNRRRRTRVIPLIIELHKIGYFGSMTSGNPFFELPMMTIFVFSLIAIFSVASIPFHSSN